MKNVFSQPLKTTLKYSSRLLPADFSRYRGPKSTPSGAFPVAKPLQTKGFFSESQNHKASWGDRLRASGTPLRCRPRWCYFWSPPPDFKLRNPSPVVRKSAPGSVFEFFRGPRALGSTPRHRGRPLEQSAYPPAVRLYRLDFVVWGRILGDRKSRISRTWSKFLL